MVLEVQMQGFENNENSYSCIIQYILFVSPHVPNSLSFFLTHFHSSLLLLQTESIRSLKVVTLIMSKSY